MFNFRKPIRNTAHAQHEKDISRSNWRRKKRVTTWAWACSPVLNILNIVALGVCLAYLLQLPYYKLSSRRGRNMPQLFPDDVIDNSHQYLFMPDHTFNPAKRNKNSDAAWESLHKRYVVIEAPARYGLPPSEPFPFGSNSSDEIYSPAVFHQLHCLRLMRYAWYSLITNGAEILTQEHPIDIPNSPAGNELGPHIEHCFDYLRQAVLCHADLSLEPWVEDDGMTRKPKGSSGWGTLHQCRNWDNVLRWVDIHAYPGNEYQ